MKKVIVGGVLAGLVMVVVGFIVGGMTAEMYRMSPAALWKPMGGNWFLQMVVYDIVVGLILSFVYSILKSAVPGSGLQKGIIFGLLVWLVGTLPGMGITYLTMNVRNLMLTVWALNGLANYVLSGMVINWSDDKLK